MQFKNVLFGIIHNLILWQRVMDNSHKCVKSQKNENLSSSNNVRLWKFKKMSTNFSSKDFLNVFETFLVAKSLCKTVVFNDSDVFRFVTRISFWHFWEWTIGIFFLLRLFRKVFEKAKLVVSQQRAHCGLPSVSRTC